MSGYKKLIAALKRFGADRRGAFAISFVMLSTLLMSLAAFGLEGSRYITERARLSDAMEQAALALTAEDNGAGAARNYTLASDYFRAWMRNEKRVITPKSR
ncbi:TadE/TadG family type IV pilus assembly protein [Mixta theicola]|uniref:TadE/TadG family type IV pilus assembly protein n=1 Tax=Mixta theicola TaxID=1458355 RepID=UPI001F0C9BD5|nr:TadE/TadG family type IV pilus assembly protein [Mixta theicola]